jgi:hypothetical protein
LVMTMRWYCSFRPFSLNLLLLLCRGRNRKWGSVLLCGFLNYGRGGCARRHGLPLRKASLHLAYFFRESANAFWVKCLVLLLVFAARALSALLLLLLLLLLLCCSYLLRHNDACSWGCLLQHWNLWHGCALFTTSASFVEAIVAKSCLRSHCCLLKQWCSDIL